MLLGMVHLILNNACLDQLANAIAGGMLPHASSALGGFIVSVDEDQLSEAKQLLESVSQPEEMPAGQPQPFSAEKKLELRFKRAVYAAVLGTMFLPVIANTYSLVQIAAVCRQNPKVIAERKVLLLIALFFNCLGFAIGLLVVAGSRLLPKYF